MISNFLIHPVYLRWYKFFETPWCVTQLYYNDVMAIWRKWTLWHVFKSWTSQFPFALMPLGNACVFCSNVTYKEKSERGSVDISRANQYMYLPINSATTGKWHKENFRRYSAKKRSLDSELGIMGRTTSLHKTYLLWPSGVSWKLYQGKQIIPSWSCWCN